MDEPLLVTPRELFLAIRYSEAEKVRMLLANGADANWRNRRGDESALAYAALKGNAEVFHLLLGAGAKDDSEDLLVEAINGGNLEIIRFELERTPLAKKRLDGLLQEAAYDGYSEVIVFLLKQGANPRAAEGTDTNPEVIARRQGHTDAAEILRKAALPVAAGVLT